MCKSFVCFDFFVKKVWIDLIIRPVFTDQSNQNDQYILGNIFKVIKEKLILVLYIRNHLLVDLENHTIILDLD